jgi:hypothetical protein
MDKHIRGMDGLCDKCEFYPCPVIDNDGMNYVKLVNYVKDAERPPIPFSG